MAFSLRALFVVITLLGTVPVFGVHYWTWHSAAKWYARVDAEWDREEVTWDQLRDASEGLLAAELNLPFLNHVAAHTRHVRCMQKIALEFNRMWRGGFRGGGGVSGHTYNEYLESLEALHQVAGFEFASRVDKDFDFPSRRNFEWCDGDSTIDSRDRNTPARTAASN